MGSRGLKVVGKLSAVERGHSGLRKAVDRTLKGLVLQSSLGVAGVTVIFAVVLAVFAQGFLTSGNVFNMSRTFSLWIIVGFSQMMVLTVGQMNLSAGAIGGLAAVTVGGMFQNLGAPDWLVILAGLGVGAGCGAFNGLFIILTGIDAFIVTLASTSIFLGINYGWTHGMPFSTVPPTFQFMGAGNVLNTIPIMFFIMVFVSLVLYFIFRHTVFGRRVLAVGGNQEAAVLSGINAKRMIFSVHTMSGLLAGLAGILFVSRLGAAHPTIGSDWLLLSFAVPVIGGTSLKGGDTSILGVVFGGVLMTLITTGLVLLNVDPFLEQLFLGVLLLLAVIVDRARTVYVRGQTFE
jgi:ribose transport system permease protein